jgi:ABC-type proline/glycine betaine transport system substrate-binding protein
VKLPDVTDECLGVGWPAADGAYACDYPVDELYKAANAGLEEKNPAAFALLSKMQLTTEQQNEIAAIVDATASRRRGRQGGSTPTRRRGRLARLSQQPHGYL